MFAACASLILVLAVPRAAGARRLARLFRAQEEWAEMMDRHAQPRRQCPRRARGAARATGTTNLSSHPPRAPPWPSCLLDSLTADSEPEMPDDIAP